MPSKKIPCPECGQPMAATSEKCRKCKPSYVRTAEHCKKLSETLAGKPKPWLKGKKRPEIGRKISAWWTEERREAKRQEMLGRNPKARYHGLSAKSAARLVQRIGHCERCNHDGSESHLGVHHKNRDKHDHRVENLEIVCHRCHMQEHAAKGETGWDSYHRKRKMNPDSATACHRPAGFAKPAGTPAPSGQRTLPAFSQGQSGRQRHNPASPNMAGL